MFRSEFGLSATVQGGDNKSRVAVVTTYFRRGRLRSWFWTILILILLIVRYYKKLDRYCMKMRPRSNTERTLEDEMSTQSTGYHYERRHECGAWRGTETRD